MNHPFVAAVPSPPRPQMEVQLHDAKVAVTMLDPLYFADADTQRYKSESSETEEEHKYESFDLQFVEEIPVQLWSVDDVASWFQRNVKFPRERMEAFLRAFHDEGIDGLRLLALQRNSRACSGMTDSEWHSLNTSREIVLASHDEAILTSESHIGTPKCSSLESLAEENSESSFASSNTPLRLQASRSMTLRSVPMSRLLSSSLRLLSFPRHLWSPSPSKDEQDGSLATDVHSLQEEIISVEEREAALNAKLNHLDEILRTAQLASYLYTRLRWTPLPGEPPADDVDVDDWLQRFLVLEGSTIFFYSRAADLRPQGAILLSEIIDIGPIPGHLHHQQDELEWFGFHITTCEGLRLECSTPLKLQMELWLSSIQVDYERRGQQEGQ